MRFSHKQFFDSYREQFGELSQSQVDGLEFLLSSFEVEPAWDSVQDIAYAFATVKHETADTFHPIYERGPRSYFDKYEPGTHIGRNLGNTQTGDGFKYRGRGYVQLTGRRLYHRFGIENEPDDALDSETAFNIMTVGMHVGTYTGKKLSDYTKPGHADYLNARRIINGTDQAQRIAGYAGKFERILTDSKISVAAAPVHLTDDDIDNLVGGLDAQVSAANPSPLDQPATDPLPPSNPQVAQPDAPPTGSTETKMIAPLESGGQVSSTTSAVEPSFIQQVTTTLTTKFTALMTFMAGLGAIGSAVLDKAQDFASKNAAIIAGIALVGLAVWYLKSRQDKAHAMQLALVNAAANPAASTVTVVK